VTRDAGRLALARGPPFFPLGHRKLRQAARVKEPQFGHPGLRRDGAKRAEQLVALVSQHVTLQAGDQRVAQERRVAHRLIGEQIALRLEHQAEKDRAADCRGNRDDRGDLHAEAIPPPQSSQRHVEKPCTFSKGTAAPPHDSD
jgi:hypothetical protein